MSSTTLEKIKPGMILSHIDQLPNIDPDSSRVEESKELMLSQRLEYV